MCPRVFRFTSFFTSSFTTPKSLSLSLARERARDGREEGPGRHRTRGRGSSSQERSSCNEGTEGRRTTRFPSPLMCTIVDTCVSCYVLATFRSVDRSSSLFFLLSTHRSIHHSIHHSTRLFALSSYGKRGAEEAWEAHTSFFASPQHPSVAPDLLSTSGRPSGALRRLFTRSCSLARSRAGSSCPKRSSALWNANAAPPAPSVSRSSSHSPRAIVRE